MSSKLKLEIPEELSESLSGALPERCLYPQSSFSQPLLAGPSSLNPYSQPFPSQIALEVGAVVCGCLEASFVLNEF